MKAPRSPIYAVHYRGIGFFESVARKPTSCWRGGGDIGPGDLAYRPLGNGVNRYRRLCGRCVIDLVARGAEHLLHKERTDAAP
jgi:hypothetical protein